MRLDAIAYRWSGVDAGNGYLRRCELDVARTARGTTDRWTITLPARGGLLVDGLEGEARPAAAQRRAPLRLVV